MLAANSAVPGLMAPVTIGSRHCMDGGMESGVHTDLAAGAGKILVIGLVHDVNQGKWTNAPGQWGREIEALRASGSAVETIVPQTDLGDPMDAKGLPLGIKMGVAQARSDAERIAQFWAR